ncbi:MAG: hypothetical protein RR549_00700 [Oscillospiraceae bacterium]
MANFDDFIAGSKAILYKVGEKTEQVVDTSKISIEIFKCEQQRAKLITKLGELVFKNKESDLKENAEISIVISKIEQTDKKIDELRIEKQQS